MMDEKDFEGHLREHHLMSEAHRKDHEQLAAELKETANELALAVRETAARLAENLRTTADTHWMNHQREHELAERAVDKAEAATKVRLDRADELAKSNKADANEWRAAMSDREAKFATKEQLGTLDKALNALNQWRDRTEGKSAGAAPMWAILVTVITAVVVLIVTRFVFPGGN